MFQATLNQRSFRLKQFIDIVCEHFVIVAFDALMCEVKLKAIKTNKKMHYLSKENSWTWESEYVEIDWVDDCTFDYLLICKVYYSLKFDPNYLEAWRIWNNCSLHRQTKIVVAFFSINLDIRKLFLKACVDLRGFGEDQLVIEVNLQGFFMWILIRIEVSSS